MNYYTLNTISLAFMGDAVYENYIREQLIRGNAVPGAQANLLHKEAVKYVCAGAQANLIKSLMADGSLSEEEQALVKRARNHRSATKPKNADAVEYKWATAFEALLGYLYLSNQKERLAEILAKALPPL